MHHNKTNPARRSLSIERLTELLEHDPVQDCFIWRVSQGGTRAGDIAGSVSWGHRYIQIDSVKYRVTDLAYFLMTSRWPERRWADREDSFWSLTQRVPATGCLEWRGARCVGGYGRVTHQGKSRLAHRLAWERTHGPIPPEMLVLHRCDNPPCIEPAHLFLGDDAANIADMIAKDRHVRGERAYNSKLTDAAVREIRASNENLSALANRYGVSINTISRVRTGKTWKHVT